MPAKRRTRPITPSTNSRRNFLRTAAIASGAAATGLAGCGKSEQPAAPQAPAGSAPAAVPSTTLRIQAGTGAGDLFFAFVQDYARIVADLSGGALQFEVLQPGAVVKAFDMADAVHKGTLDAGFAVPAFWYNKNSALSLFGTGPAFGHNGNTFLSWLEHGGGKALYEELYRDVLKLDVVPFLMGPMMTQPLGWFKKEVKTAAEFKGLKYRTVGLSVDVFTAMGAAVTAMPGPDVVPALTAVSSKPPGSTTRRWTLPGLPDVASSAWCAATISLPNVSGTDQQERFRCAAGPAKIALRYAEVLSAEFT
jgi:TRAP-type mannitol/chloroaromatic compound transport system substrate-binding protein